MKKKISTTNRYINIMWAFLIFLFIVMLIIYPKNRNPKTNFQIDQANIEYTLLENGDLEVKEEYLFPKPVDNILRTYYSNSSVLKENTSDNEGEDLYRADGLKNFRVYNIVNNKKNYLPIYLSSFTNRKIIEGNYYYTSSNNQLNFKIDNPTKNDDEKFYIEYTLLKIGLKHLDYGELSHNVLNEDFNHNIKKIELIINLPNNKKEAYAWSDIERHDKWVLSNKQKITYQLKNYTEKNLDIRIFFDRDVINKAEKGTDQKSLHDIIKIFSIMDGKIKILEKIMGKDELSIRKFLIIFYIIVNICRKLKDVITIYKKYDKEYVPEFQYKYLRDLPSEHTPTQIEFLFNREITIRSFSATIADLIQKKYLLISLGRENLESDTKKTTYLKINPEKDIAELPLGEKFIIDWLFENVDTITAEDIGRFSKEEDREKFYNKYLEWRDLSEKEAENLDFFENDSYDKELKKYNKQFIVDWIVLALMILHLDRVGPVSFLIILYFFIGVIYYTYINSVSKRKHEHNELYAKWNALRNYLKDFGNMKEKDLQDVVLWEEILVYSSVFGISKELYKSIQTQYPDIYQDLSERSLTVKLGQNLFEDIANNVNDSIEIEEKRLEEEKEKNTIN